MTKDRVRQAVLEKYAKDRPVMVRLEEICLHFKMMWLKLWPWQWSSRSSLLSLRWTKPLPRISAMRLV